MAKGPERVLNIRAAVPAEKQRIIDFVNSHFDMPLEMINNPVYFDYYYVDGETLQFVVAECEGEYMAVCGYIKANCAGSHIWASVLAADDSFKGAGIRLLNEMKNVTGAEVIASNNIREKTCVLYSFLGWHAARIPHFYRLAQKQSYSLAVPGPEELILPAGGNGVLRRILSEEDLDTVDIPETGNIPKKDKWYIKRRYFGFPKGSYDMYALEMNGRVCALLIVRVITAAETGCVPVLRISDYIGNEMYLPEAGAEIQRLMDECGAEYTDCYCAGINPLILEKTGFRERLKDSSVIIPNYLVPPLIENTEYFYYTSEPENFVLFKADGDQDRPR